MELFIDATTDSFQCSICHGNPEHSPQIFAYNFVFQISLVVLMALKCLGRNFTFGPKRFKETRLVIMLWLFFELHMLLECNKHEVKTFFATMYINHCTFFCTVDILIFIHFSLMKHNVRYLNYADCVALT